MLTGMLIPWSDGSLERLEAIIFDGTLLLMVCILSCWLDCDEYDADADIRHPL